MIAQLDPLGYGPKIMQSDHDFGVAGTFCVNAHGWAVPMGPMGSSVQSFDLVLPDGELVSCSRTENADLFGMTMGGYGLTGAIIKMELDIARNLRLDPSFTEMPAAEFGDHFVNAANSVGVNMAYGRLSVDRANFFEKALMVTYRPSRDQSDIPDVSGPGAKTELARRFYRAQIGSDLARRMRWLTQEIIGGVIALGGSYYLAYRPHARRDQFMRAYPQAAEFAAAKRQLDPDEVFQNNFWTTYLA